MSRCRQTSLKKSSCTKPFHHVLNSIPHPFGLVGRPAATDLDDGCVISGNWSSTKKMHSNLVQTKVIASGVKIILTAGTGSKCH